MGFTSPLPVKMAWSIPFITGDNHTMPLLWVKTGETPVEVVLLELEPTLERRADVAVALEVALEPCRLLG